jgi:DNA gyrase subunit A
MNDKINPTSITKVMEKFYMDYAMSVIVQRALPDVRDGLKPVHRRILFAMHKSGFVPGGKPSKCAKIVGEVLGKYHPHGDVAVYDALVRMAQEFSMRYPLIKGQGNFGSIDGDSPAAMRYTEASLARFSQEMLFDIAKETVDTTPNFDSTLEEPVILPARVPNLLLNGADGIAVGMATKIPPHNLTELCQALNHILKNCEFKTEKDFELKKIGSKLSKKLSTRERIYQEVEAYSKLNFTLDTAVSAQDLTEFVKGPDFPTAGEIHGRQSIIELYTTGKGKIIVRGQAEIKENRQGKVSIIISQLPYQVNKANLVTKIADLVKDKKIIGISDLRDESDRQGIRVVVELRRSARPKTILNKLYKFTALQTSYPANIVALADGVPQTLNLRQILLHFLRHRQTIVRRRSIFDLKEAKIRAHILEGLKIALDNLDEIIKTIRNSKDADVAKERLMANFKLSDLQAVAILDMQLRKLAALERQKIEEEYASLQESIKNFINILSNPGKMLSILQDENKQIIEKYKSPRRTKIYIHELNQLDDEDLIASQDVLVSVTKTGYIKRVAKDTYRSQKRGGKGVVGMGTKESDEVDHLLSVNTHDYLLFFTNQGKCFRLRVWELPEGNRQAKGQAVINLINISPGDQVQAILPIKKDSTAKFILMATKNGVVKKTNLKQFKNIRQSGLTSIKLDKEDQLAWVKLTSGQNQILLVTKNGKCIRFRETDVRPMGRHTRGVRGILLKAGDHLINMDTIPEKLPRAKDKRRKLFKDLLFVSENGFGKRSDVYSYPLQKRGGVGVKVANLTKKTGNVATSLVVDETHKELLLTSRSALIIKLPIKNIPRLQRNTQGVILMRFKKKGDQVSTAASIVDPTLSPEKE